MQARYRSVKERILNGAAFCGGKCIRAFSIPESDASAGIRLRRGIESRGPERCACHSG